MDDNADQPYITARIRTKVPADSAERSLFAVALEAVAASYPVDDFEPIRSDVIHEASSQLVAVGLARCDPEDNTDWSEALADAYFAARAHYAARSSTTGGNA